MRCLAVAFWTGLLAWCASSPSLQAATIWTGPRIVFEKPDGADWRLPENQDRLTDSVWITRGASRGLFNAFEETFAALPSPSGTLWAVGTTADLPQLAFATWNDIFGTAGTIGGPPNSVGQDFVLHLISADAYVDVRFESWSAGRTGGEGGFRYSRTTAGVAATADFNADGLVDGPDYLAWQGGFGFNAGAGGSAPLALGNANNDQFVDANDLAIWQSQFGSGQLQAGAERIPEPAAAALCLGAAVTTVCMRRWFAAGSRITRSDCT